MSDDTKDSAADVARELEIIENKGPMPARFGWTSRDHITIIKPKVPPEIVHWEGGKPVPSDGAETTHDDEDNTPHDDEDKAAHGE
ncbi:MAG: hypothetical protein Q4G40_12875 [Brachybacterium sp.]|nr:hypothetical protein [Brachybacterium sp.]